VGGKVIQNKCENIWKNNVLITWEMGEIKLGICVTGLHHFMRHLQLWLRLRLGSYPLYKKKNFNNEGKN
jgi:hypothetical protein